MENGGPADQAMAEQMEQIPAVDLAAVDRNS